MKFSDIKKGDFLYYTERPFSNYADSLVEVREIDGKLFGHTICDNFQGKYINEPPDGWQGAIDLLISNYYNENCLYPTTYTLNDGDASKWMDKNFPLDMPSITVEEIYVLYQSSIFYPNDRKIIGIYTDKKLLELNMNCMNASNKLFNFHYKTYEPNKIDESFYSI